MSSYDLERVHQRLEVSYIRLPESLHDTRALSVHDVWWLMIGRFGVVSGRFQDAEFHLCPAFEQKYEVSLPPSIFHL